jgi:hypothetical protein
MERVVSWKDCTSPNNGIYASSKPASVAPLRPSSCYSLRLQPLTNPSTLHADRFLSLGPLFCIRLLIRSFPFIFLSSFILPCLFLTVPYVHLGSPSATAPALNDISSTLQMISKCPAYESCSRLRRHLPRIFASSGSALSRTCVNGDRDDQNPIQ